MAKIVLVVSFVCVIMSSLFAYGNNAIEFKKADDLYLEVLEAVE